MAQNKSVPMHVDIRLNPEQVQEQTNKIIKNIQNIGNSLKGVRATIDGIFDNINKKVEATNKKLAKQTSYFMQFTLTGDVPAPVADKAGIKGVKSVYSLAQKNIALESELKNQYYRQHREKKILLDAQKKQIDNEIKIKNGLKKVKEETKKVTEATKKVTEATKKTTAGTKGLLGGVTKIILSVSAARRLGSITAKLVKESGAWIENLNLFEVTFGENYKKYLDFSVDLAKNLGFSVNEMVKFTGLFKQLSTSIGIADEVGSELAQTLTAIGNDITSFYNLRDVTQAMEKLQAGIFSGQTKPLRSIGIDEPKCVALHSNVYRKQGEHTNVWCNNYNLMLVA